jgi:hypothetical protein
VAARWGRLDVLVNSAGQDRRHARQTTAEESALMELSVVAVLEKRRQPFHHGGRGRAHHQRLVRRGRRAVPYRAAYKPPSSRWRAQRALGGVTDRDRGDAYPITPPRRNYETRSRSYRGRPWI